MFEILIKLMNELRQNIGSSFLENNFNLSLTNVEDEIQRLARIPACTIEAIRSEVKNFTDTLVYSSAHDSESLFEVHKQLLTIRIDALFQALAEQKRASSLSLDASSQIGPSVVVRSSNANFSMSSLGNDEQRGLAMKKAGGDVSHIPLRRQRRYPVDLDRLHANKPSSLNASINTDYNTSRNNFLNTPIFLPLIDQQRQEIQFVFSCIEEILLANNLEGMLEIGPMFAEQIMDILKIGPSGSQAFELFISRMIHIQRHALTENESLLHLFIDNFKEIPLFKEKATCEQLPKMQNIANASTLSIKIPTSAVDAEEGLSGSERKGSATTDYPDHWERERFLKRRPPVSSSSSMKQATSAGIAFYRPGSPRENAIMKSIQALEPAIFDAWIKPLRDLLDIYAPPTNCAVSAQVSSAAVCVDANADEMEINFSAQYLRLFIHQLESIRQGSLVLDSVSSLEDLMVSIQQHFHHSLPRQIDRDQMYLIDAEIFGERGDSAISDALMTFKLQGEEGVVYGMRRTW